MLVNKIKNKWSYDNKKYKSSQIKKQDALIKRRLRHFPLAQVKTKIWLHYFWIWMDFMCLLKTEASMNKKHVYDYFNATKYPLGDQLR